MGHGADEFAVLDDWAAAHTLHDPAGQLQQVGIGHFYNHVFVAMIASIYLDDLYLIFPHFLFHRTSDHSRSFFYILHISYRYRRDSHFFLQTAGCRSKNSFAAIHFNLTDLHGGIIIDTAA